MKRSVLDYLENTAKRCPERLAWDASAPFTFGQWWDAAQRIASSLSSRCARNTPVAVLMNPRSAECVKVFFGVWAAGCFYAPLDPMLPPERLKLIMQNLEPTAIVYDEFMVYCLLRNNGADDLTYVQVKDGDEVVAEKLYTVCGGSWRVVEIPVTIATPGEHTITVGTQSGTITIAE